MYNNIKKIFKSRKNKIFLILLIVSILSFIIYSSSFNTCGIGVECPKGFFHNLTSIISNILTPFSMKIGYSLFVKFLELGQELREVLGGILNILYLYLISYLLSLIRSR